MEWVTIVTVLAIGQFIWFGVQVGSMRGKHEVKAPAMTGHPEFERMSRIQMNTLEQMVCFLPALWMYAHLGNPLWGAGLGVVYLIGRFIYRSAYLKDPGGRTAGFMITFLPTAVMLVWVLIDSVLGVVR